MNERRQGISRLLGFGSIAVASALITVSCAGAEPAALTPLPTAEASPAGSSSPGPTLQSGPTAAAIDPASAAPVVSESPASPSPGATEPSEATFTHRSIVVVIPDAASPSPGPDAAASATDPQQSEAAASAVPFVPEDSVDTTEKRLNVTVGGETVYIRNGGRIDMGDGLAVEVYIDPYPPDTLHSSLDIYVTRDGEPVPEASVDIEFDMLSMLHGPFFGPARDIGGGHHLATLDYIMFGAWDQFVTIRIGLDRIRFPVVIVAYP